LLIHNIMVIPNDPLPDTIPMPIVTTNPEQSNHVPLIALVVNIPTVTTHKSFSNTKRKIRSTSHTA